MSQKSGQAVKEIRNLVEKSPKTCAPEVQGFARFGQRYEELAAEIHTARIWKMLVGRCTGRKLKPIFNPRLRKTTDLETCAFALGLGKQRALTLESIVRTEGDNILAEIRRAVETKDASFFRRFADALEKLLKNEPIDPEREFVSLIYQRWGNTNTKRTTRKEIIATVQARFPGTSVKTIDRILRDLSVDYSHAIPGPKSGSR
jgi:hypothetical protein